MLRRLIRIKENNRFSKLFGQEARPRGRDFCVGKEIVADVERELPFSSRVRFT
jgi:hypothetical protein